MLELAGPLAQQGPVQRARQVLAPQALQALPDQLVQELQALLGPQELALPAPQALLAFMEQRVQVLTALAELLAQPVPQVQPVLV